MNKFISLNNLFLAKQHTSSSESSVAANIISLFNLLLVQRRWFFISFTESDLWWRNFIRNWHVSSVWKGAEPDCQRCKTLLANTTRCQIALVLPSGPVALISPLTSVARNKIKRMWTNARILNGTNFDDDNKRIRMVRRHVQNWCSPSWLEWTFVKSSFRRGDKESRRAFMGAGLRESTYEGERKIWKYQAPTSQRMENLGGLSVAEGYLVCSSQFPLLCLSIRLNG